MLESIAVAPKREPVLPQYKSLRVSLLDMLRFYARGFHTLSGDVVRLRTNPNLMFDAFVASDFVDRILPGIISECEALGLRLSQNQAEWILEHTRGQKCTPIDMEQWLKELDKRINEELEGQLFYYIPGHKARFADLWPSDVPLRMKFRASVEELEEAAKCYAFGLGTACVFHSMRALEKGLLVFARLVLGQEPQLENWKNIIDQIEAKIRSMENDPKGTAKSETLKFYCGLAVQFRYFKEAWRNHVSHSRETYKEEKAHSIMQHVFEFLRDAAAGGLSE